VNVFEQISVRGMARNEPHRLAKMYKFSWMVLGVAIVTPVLSLAANSDLQTQPAWPAGVQKKDDQRILAFYDGQCARYADQNGLTGEKRAAFVSNCRANIPSVFPVGYAGGDGGGGDE